MASFDLKRNWPVLAAGGMGLVALMAFRSSAQGGGSQLVPVPPAGAAPAGGSSGGGMDPATASSLLGEALQYEASVAGTTASEYATYIGAGASDYQATIGGQVAESQNYAAAAAAAAARPSWLQQFTGLINAAANAYATYQTGGVYRQPSYPSSYSMPRSGWPSTNPPAGFYGYPAPAGSVIA